MVWLSWLVKMLVCKLKFELLISVVVFLNVWNGVSRVNGLKVFMWLIFVLCGMFFISVVLSMVLLCLLLYSSLVLVWWVLVI